MLFAVIVPLLGAGIAMVMLWGRAFRWIDVVLLVGLYVLCAFGTTIGFHRYFTHKGFEARLPVKVTLGILGCMTMQGPIIQWVTDHRKHHALSDQPGDPHSPHAGFGDGFWGRVRGFSHAHVGWMFSNLGMEQGRVYGKDLYEDRVIVWLDRLYLAVGGAVAGDPVPHRVPRRRRLMDPRARGDGVGRALPDLPLPARHLLGELDLPHVRSPGVPHA